MRRVKTEPARNRGEERTYFDKVNGLTERPSKLRSLINLIPQPWVRAHAADLYLVSSRTDRAGGRDPTRRVHLPSDTSTTDQADCPAARPHELLPHYFECFGLGWRPEKTFARYRGTRRALPLLLPRRRDKYGIKHSGRKLHSLDVTFNGSHHKVERKNVDDEATTTGTWTYRTYCTCLLLFPRREITR